MNHIKYYKPQNDIFLDQTLESLTNFSDDHRFKLDLLWNGA